MTDKEIIIDGVNVAGCDFLAKEDFYSSYSGEYTAYKGQCGCSDEEMCKDHPKCFYKKALKQLRRKEQECKLLKVTLKDKNFVAVMEENEKLKQECEELKRTRDDNFLDAIEQRHQVNRYKQALEKIEEIIHNKSIITYEIRDIKTILNEVSNNDK